MKKEWYEKRLSANHFCLMIGLLWFGTQVIPFQQQTENINGRLNLLPLQEWPEEILRGNSFILFVDSTSSASQEMKQKLQIIAGEMPEAGRFYYVPISPSSSGTSHLSGSPTLIALKEGHEVRRTVGVIPLRNLKRICNQLNEK